MGKGNDNAIGNGNTSIAVFCAVVSGCCRFFGGAVDIGCG